MILTSCPNAHRLPPLNLTTDNTHTLSPLCRPGCTGKGEEEYWDVVHNVGKRTEWRKEGGEEKGVQAVICVYLILERRVKRSSAASVLRSVVSMVNMHALYMFMIPGFLRCGFILFVSQSGSLPMCNAASNANSVGNSLLWLSTRLVLCWPWLAMM